MAPKKSVKRKRMSTRASEAPESNKKAWKPRGPNFSAPTEMVTFFIGKEGSDEKFPVHKEFACHHSPVLSAAFNSNFMEGETQTYRLEDINPSTFRLLVQWLYHGKFDVFKQDDLECADDENDPEIEKLWAAQDLDLVQLWIVADKLLIRPLQNAVIAVLEEFWEEPFVRQGGPTTSWIPSARNALLKLPMTSLKRFFWIWQLF
ncbi:hypothetical protein NA56DRAFT_365262 [Hyaloscypha hepaticicola]|uniref:BTB domain-containing protein n=1 Tax=Hyaloscypha hepaticicola TaxID=2082293 RepID=A0A2J6PLD7_9HELO|nr:hypothetical protein NA56DRAFT_365262 [Hyaloscypha hepaticicola]